LERLPEKNILLWVEREGPLRQLFTMDTVPQKLLPRLREWDGETPLQELPIQLENFRDVQLITLSGGYVLHREFYDKCVDSARGFLSTFWKNKLTLNFFGPLWGRNLWRNLEYLGKNSSCLTLHSLRLTLAGRSVLVLGAGPGLESILESLKIHRDRFFIIAVDTALGVLLDCGIRPDLIAVLEGQVHNLADFHDAAGSGIPVAVDLSAHPHSSRITGGPVLWTATHFAPLSLWDRLETEGFPALPLEPMGSVGNYAVEFALLLSGSEVWYAGLDFSYPEGKTHARGSPHHKRLLARQDRLHPVLTTAYSYPSQAHTKKGWRTTSVLQGYAANMHARSQNRLRLFSQTVPPSRVSTLRVPISFSPGTWEPKEFFLGEKELLLKLKKCIQDIRAGVVPENWDKLIRDADHLWYWFPNTELPSLETSFLNRVLVQIEKLLITFGSI